MTSTRFLQFSIPAILLPAALAMALPGSTGAWYAKLAEPGVLFLDCGLALWVARMYREHLRTAFIGIGLFLFFYGFLSIEPVVVAARDLLGSKFLWSLVVYQVFTYWLLFVGCLSILRVVEVTRLNRVGWLVVAVGVAVGLGIILNNVSPFLAGLETERLYTVLIMVIRVFDVMVLIMLLPVLLLYVQHARARYQDSATFAVAMIGVIGSLSLVYLYEAVRRVPLSAIAASEYQHGSALDALYVFGYLLVAVGLYAHRMHQQWSLRAMDGLLATQNRARV